MDDEIRALLADIVFWGERLRSHIELTTSADFAADIRTCDAVCWCIVCIGEAAGAIKRLRPDLAQEQPALELARAYAMRNRLAHDYGGIDVGVVWEAATVSVPDMVRAAQLHLVQNDGRALS